MGRRDAWQCVTKPLVKASGQLLLRRRCCLRVLTSALASSCPAAGQGGGPGHHHSHAGGGAGRCRHQPKLVRTEADAKERGGARAWYSPRAGALPLRHAHAECTQTRYHVLAVAVPVSSPSSSPAIPEAHSPLPVPFPFCSHSLTQSTRPPPPPPPPRPPPLRPPLPAPRPTGPRTPPWPTTRHWRRGRTDRDWRGGRRRRRGRTGQPGGRPGGVAWGLAIHANGGRGVGLVRMGRSAGGLVSWICEWRGLAAPSVVAWHSRGDFVHVDRPNSHSLRSLIPHLVSGVQLCESRLIPCPSATLPLSLTQPERRHHRPQRLPAPPHLLSHLLRLRLLASRHACVGPGPGLPAG